MEIINFSESPSLISTYIAEIRDRSIQTDRLRFRENIRRMGQLMGYELSKRLAYKEMDVETPLGIAPSHILDSQPVVASILRAGLPLHQGVLDSFDRADNTFISAYRKTHADHSFDVEVEYLASPSIQGRTLILCDPMLATGQSMMLCYDALLQKGIPEHTHIVSLIGSAQGVAAVADHMGDRATLWIGAIDEEMNAKSYIVPGLGDAGDLAFGGKDN